MLYPVERTQANLASASKQGEASTGDSSTNSSKQLLEQQMKKMKEEFAAQLKKERADLVALFQASSNRQESQSEASSVAGASGTFAKAHTPRGEPSKPKVLNPSMDFKIGSLGHE